jgi:hypothetical protein
MNQAVGRPRAKVRRVVTTDSQSERQKIARWASAAVTVPSKMSRWKKTRNQASPVKGSWTPP